MAGGAVLTAILFALVTQLLVSRRIERSLRAAPGRRDARARRGGRAWARSGSRSSRSCVAAGRRVVVIDRDEDGPPPRPGPAPSDVPVVIGDATDAAVLDAANLGAARGRGRADQRRPGQRRDRAWSCASGWASAGRRCRWCCGCSTASWRAAVEEAFGFHNVRSTAALAAPWFVGAALGLDVLGTFYVDRTPFLVGRIAVAAGGGLDGLAMRRAVRTGPGDRPAPRRTAVAWSTRRAATPRSPRATRPTSWGCPTRWCRCCAATRPVSQWSGWRCRSRGSCGRSWRGTCPGAGPPRPCCRCCPAARRRSRRTRSPRAG